MKNWVVLLLIIIMIGLFGFFIVPSKMAVKTSKKVEPLACGETKMQLIRGKYRSVTRICDAE